MPHADVLLTDISSVMFYFLALDRPVILVNNPCRYDDPAYFDPAGPEWTWRDMGVEVSNAKGLCEAIETSFQDPEFKSDRRCHYRHRIFGQCCNGQAAARIADRIRRLLQPPPEDGQWVESIWNSVGLIATLSESHHQMGERVREMEWVLNDSLAGRLTSKLEEHPKVKSIIKRILHRGNGNGSTPIADGEKLRCHRGQ